MDEWTEIQRKVLVEEASKRSIHRDYGHQALTKILANPDPSSAAQGLIFWNWRLSRPR
jgi:hypothetical protein